MTPNKAFERTRSSAGCIPWHSVRATQLIRKVTLEATRFVAKLCVFLAISCSQPPPHETDIEFSESWFTCEARFECVVVNDAFCKTVAVNSKHTLVYQDWSRQEVTRHGERAVCSNPKVFAGGAGCRKGRCVYPFGLEDYVDDPNKE